MGKEKKASLKSIYEMLQAEEIKRNYEQAKKKAEELAGALGEEVNDHPNDKTRARAFNRVSLALLVLEEVAEDINTIKRQLKTI